MNALASAFFLAQGSGTPAAGSSDSGMTPTLIMFALLFAIMYFLLWRPQKKREEERRELLKRIKKNDHVITNGGIHGVVTSLKDDEVTLKVDEAQNVKIRFARSAITSIVGEGETQASGGERPGKQ